MKHLVLLCLTLSGLPVQGEEMRQAAVAPSISLYTEFQQPPSAEFTGALHDELDAIMNPIGMRFGWRSLAVRGDHEVSVELAVVHFKGQCNAADLLPMRINPGALGWTHVSDGVILPFSDLDCDRIRSFVQHDLLGVAADEREAVLGRAVARVLAHELYHIFARTAKHAACGVAKAAYTVQELLSDAFVFEGKESDMLRGSTKSRNAFEANGSM